MIRYFWAVLILLSLFGNSTLALGQNSKFFVETFLGAGFLAMEGGTWNEFNGGYSFPEMLDKQGNPVLYKTWYVAEYKGNFALRGNLGYQVMNRFSIFFANEFALPQYNFSSSYSRYYPNLQKGEESAGPPTGYPEFKIASGSYYYSSAIGVRAFAFNNSRGPYFEFLWGRVFRHIDLAWDRRVYSPSRFHEFSRLRDRSSRGLMRLGIGSAYPLSARASLRLNLALTTVREAGGGFYFLDETGQYFTFDGAIGMGFTF